MALWDEDPRLEHLLGKHYAARKLALGGQGGEKAAARNALRKLNKTLAKHIKDHNYSVSVSDLASDYRKEREVKTGHRKANAKGQTKGSKGKRGSRGKGPAASIWSVLKQTSESNLGVGPEAVAASIFEQGLSDFLSGKSVGDTARSVAQQARHGVKVKAHAHTEDGEVTITVRIPVSTYKTLKEKPTAFGAAILRQLNRG